MNNIRVTDDGIWQGVLLRFSPITGMPWPAVGRMALWTAEEFRAAQQPLDWKFNPWTGRERDTRDIESDPRGYLIVPPLS